MEAVTEAIAESGGRALVTSVRDLPRDCAVALSSSGRAIFQVAGDTVSSDRLTGVWVWHVRRPDVEALAPHVRRYVRRDWELAVAGLAAVTADALWVNHPRASSWIEGNKLEQIRLARSCGLTASETLVSNELEEIVSFASRFESVAVKSQGGVWSEDPNGVRAAFTQRCTSEDLRRAGASLRQVPVVVQPYVEKESELRVTVIDDRASFVRIDSQTVESAALDWRRAVLSEVPHALMELAREDRKRAIALVRAAGLRYAALDFVATPKGGLVFLDLNPSGQFGWLEAQTGAPITTALAEALVARQ